MFILLFSLRYLVRNQNKIAKKRSLGVAENVVKKKRPTTIIKGLVYEKKQSLQQLFSFPKKTKLWLVSTQKLVYVYLHFHVNNTIRYLMIRSKPKVKTMFMYTYTWTSLFLRLCLCPTQKLRLYLCTLTRRQDYSEPYDLCPGKKTTERYSYV